MVLDAAVNGLAPFLRERREPDTVGRIDRVRPVRRRGGLQLLRNRGLLGCILLKPRDSKGRPRHCGARPFWNPSGHNEGAQVQVLVRDNNVDQALKALKKKMQREGIFREMKLRGHYEKPSEKKAREKAEAIRRARKLARKKMQREGLLPMKPKPAPGAGAGGPGRSGGAGGARRFG